MVLYKNIAHDADVALQPTDQSGVRALITFGSEDAPIRYDFPVSLDYGNFMQLQLDGSVIVFDKNGYPQSMMDKPWAKDANGNDIATFFEINDNKLSQIILHSSKNQYPIIADPWWNPWSWREKKSV